MNRNVQQFRQQKDEYMKFSPQSPIPHDERSAFQGLEYYDYNEALALRLPASEFDDKEEIEMQTSTGDLRNYLRWGEINFEVDGKPARLTLYYSPAHGHFFLPFMDATSGTETYGAGRYLDPEMVDDGVFEVDFNMAYSPFCAYNPAYSCPIPPAENRLKVPIEAGEKLLESHQA